MNKKLTKPQSQSAGGQGFTQPVAKLQAGFTIIEVLIVLAIAGLILAIVFLAVPQLQRNARDNSRQNTLTRLKAEIETYAANNSGTYPFITAGDAACGGVFGVGVWSDFFCRYVSSSGLDIKDPSSGTDVITSLPATSAANNVSYVAGYVNGMALPGTGGVDAKGKVAVIFGAKCVGENVTNSGSPLPTTKSYVLLIGLDRNGTRYCIDNG